MATRIIMPKLGMAMKEGMLGKWSVDDGGRVEADETIAVIVTKKITYELKAPSSGILHHRVRAKETRPVGQVIGYIAAPGEAVPEDTEPLPAPEAPLEEPAQPVAAAPAPSAAPTPSTAVQEDGFVIATPAARRVARQAGIQLAAVPGTGPGGRVTEDDVRSYLEQREKVLVSSAAAKLADREGVDAAQIQGTGTGGRVMEEDVRRQLAGEAPAAVPAQPEPPAAAEAPPPQKVPFTGLRQIIAENMHASLQTMAQVSMATEVDVTELVDLRARMKRDFDLTYTDLIVKATAIALRKHPRLNSTLVDEEIHLIPETNIGIGVALEEGLIVPVIRNADRLSIPEIGAKMRDLAARARSDNLDLDEISGGTFTITNLGAYGIDAFTPVINPPEAAILGVGRIVEKLALYRGEAARRSMMVLSLTFDHRVVDGAPAAAFLQTLADILSHPYYLNG